MPIGSGVPDAAGGPSWGGTVGHENGVNINFTAGASWEDEADGDEAIQDLIDYLAAWPELNTNQPPSATRVRIYGYPITVTEPE